MKILVLNGSPKQKSDTMRVTRAFLDGVRKTGDHEIEIVDVIKQNIKPCIGCFECWKNQDGKCVIDDYQNVLLEKMMEADCIIWSFPMYCFGMPSHLKAVLDRTLPLSRITSRKDSDKVNQGKVEGFTPKKYIVICGCGFPASVVSFESLKTQCIHMFGRVRMIRVTETPLMNIQSAEHYTKPLLDNFVAAGEEFGNTTFIKRETLEKLETPMVPNEEYLKLAEFVAQKVQRKRT